MLKFDQAEKAVGQTITLNEIPVGETFRGTIHGRGGSKITGLFFKANGPFTLRGKEDGSPALGVCDVVVVRLDRPGLQENGSANFWSHCRTVEHYQPVTLRIVEEK